MRILGIAALAALAAFATLATAPTTVAQAETLPGPAREHQAKEVVLYDIRPYYITSMVSPLDFACTEYPNFQLCPVIRSMGRGDLIEPFCQQPGEVINGNPWWTLGYGPNGSYGLVPNWFIDYPGNKLPGVPRCVG